MSLRLPAVRRAVAIGLMLIASLHCVSQLTAADTKVDYQREIRPLLAQHCYRCHGRDAKQRRGELRLDDRTDAIRIRTGGSVIVPGKPDESELIHRLRSDDASLRMPPEEVGPSLTETQIRLISQWISEGAEYADHWLFAPLSRPQIPANTTSHDVANAIDVFLLESQQKLGLVPAQPASPRVLLKRLALDVGGLPPSALGLRLQPDQESEMSEQVWQQLVNRALMDPAFGEHLATFWFDLIRYANTVGYHGDQDHHISPFRDYVIQAFNDDLPFDQFTREQLAGDLLPSPTKSQHIATGYNRVLQTSHEGGVQKAEYQKKYDADRVRNLGAVWLGLTTACAECHDHKYDPITQRDFYRLAAFFSDIDDSRSFNGGDTNPTRREPEIDVFEEPLLRQLEQMQKQEAELKRSDGEMTDKVALKSMQTQLNQLRKQGRRSMVTERCAPRIVRVLNRGDWMDETGEVVSAGPPEFLPRLSPTIVSPTRLDLANWLTSEAQAITARVFVNRIWARFFGQGLVTTLDDYGIQGDAPSNPELLDWLANEFIDSGWSVKELVRIIVTSRAYRLSSEIPQSEAALDLQNRWLTRQNRWRLGAEQIRDQALAVSGLLVMEQRGRPVKPWQPAGYYVQLNFPLRDYVPDRDAGQYRRAVYMHWQRQYLHPMLKAFDAPMREECVAQRIESNTPQAALVLLNDPTFVECARRLAVRAIQSGVVTDAGRVAFLWGELLDRSPSPSESETLVRYVAMGRAEFTSNSELAAQLLTAGMYQAPTSIDRTELAVWTSTARVLLNLSEFLTRE